MSEVLSVKNISRGPQTVEGAGTLVRGEISHSAEDNDHTRAMIAAGLLLEVDDSVTKTPVTKGKTTGEKAGDKED